MAKQKKLKIALDFDETVTADRQLWKYFIDEAKARGHEIRIVTFRSDNGFGNEDIEAFAKETDLEIIYTNGLQKATQWEADIWIDDMPVVIPKKKELLGMATGCGLLGE